MTIRSVITNISECQEWSVDAIAEHLLIEGNLRLQQIDIRNKLKELAKGVTGHESKPPEYYVRFTTINKFGNNPLQHKRYSTPQGIYAYPVTQEFVREHIIKQTDMMATKYKFMHLFKVKPSSYNKVLYLDKAHYSDTDLYSDLDKLEYKYKVTPPISKEDGSKFIKDIDALIGTIKSKIQEDKYKVSYIKDIVDLVDKYHTNSMKQKSLLFSNNYDETIAFIHSVKYKPISVKVMDTVRDTIIDKLVSSAAKKLGDVIRDAFETIQIREAPDIIWHVTGKVATYFSKHNRITEWTKILKFLGYDWVYDPGNSLLFFSEPTQAVFFNTQMLDLIWSGPNPRNVDNRKMPLPDEEDYTEKMRSFLARVEKNIGK